MEYTEEDGTHGVCQGTEEEDDDRKNDARMFSNPVADNMALYWWDKGGAKTRFVNVETVCNIVGNNRRAKVGEGHGGGTIRGSRNGNWGRDVNYATIWLIEEIRGVSRRKRKELL